MRISDWSSDVCSSDLLLLKQLPLVGEVLLELLHPLTLAIQLLRDLGGFAAVGIEGLGILIKLGLPGVELMLARFCFRTLDRKSVVWGKGVSVRVDFGGGRIIKKKKKEKLTTRS